METSECKLCGQADFRVQDIITACREQGWGYKKTYRTLTAAGHDVSRSQVQVHLGHLERTVMSAIASAEDAGLEVDSGFFARHGIELPPDGTVWVAATVEQRGVDGEKHWVRIKPEIPLEAIEDRIEIRQAQPVVVEGKRPTLTILNKGNWATWLINPDLQIGYWKTSTGDWLTTHDERCFSVGHQIAKAMADSEGLHGWLDLGDFLDLAAPSRHNPTVIDLHVDGLNKTIQRGSEELARRRWLVGEEGEVVVLGGNHDCRLPKATSTQMPYLVGLRRADDPEDEAPMLSVPYLVRARDHGVEWVPSFPNSYRRLSGNLVAVHAPAYGSKALDTARKISALIHASVVFGHTHRHEAISHSIETRHGPRTFDLWSDGCWARTDGSVPSAKSTYDDYMNRLTRQNLPDKVGLIGENWHQGFSFVHVETGGRERFSVERVAIWDGWAQFRGVQFEADCDENGAPLTQLVEAA